MSLPWFCMYSEWATDPKVQMLSEAMQRRMVMLFCDECAEQTPMSDEQRAFKWRITPEAVAETKALFLEYGIVDEDWNVLNWEKRQRRDLSTPRVQKHRAMKRGETLHETDETASETFPTVLHNKTIHNKTNKKEIYVENPSDVSTAPLGIVCGDESALREALANESSGASVRSLPLLDGEVFEITESFVAKLKEAFPRVNVVEQIDRIGKGLLSGRYKLRDKSPTIAFITGRCRED
ncbi:hypothetical protein P8935_14505 [Telmatobacter sp. DSM 110680]|uniref:Uncharacterized protein n=1 Tax=Telmatobacter sp. DSM 110680 TaxID=3036704 RepID=A0AAU7DEM1_9BACT